MRGAWCVLVAVVAVWCGGGVAEAQVNTCFPDERVAVVSPSFPSNVERFGLDFFRRVANKMPKSVFISPYSVWSALTLAYFGSAGATREQMEQAMFFNTKTATYSNWNALKFMLERGQNTDGSGAVLRTTNRAYFSNILRLSPCLSNTLFDLRLIDFTNSGSARRAINQEVNATTEGRIPELISQLPPQTRFALVNAVFFKGEWKSAFRVEETRRQEFLVPPGTASGVVDMMVQERVFNQGFSEQLDATMLELPYKNSTISMFVLLPKTWYTESIVNNLTPATFASAYHTMTPKNTLLGLPRFSLTTRIEEEFKEVLIRAGIRDLFDVGQADLSEFTVDGVSLNVDTAIHQATVEVTEEGTVAAAATAFINTRFGGGAPISFMCNRPFVFLITDKRTGITLFAGEVLSSTDLDAVSVATPQK